jgi:hypothetical protein
LSCVLERGEKGREGRLDCFSGEGEEEVGEGDDEEEDGAESVDDGVELRRQLLPLEYTQSEGIPEEDAAG